MNRLTRSILIFAVTAFSGSPWLAPNEAASAGEMNGFGDEPLHLIVGMPPGGGVDAYARLLQRHMPEHIPSAPSIVVQNMPGAGSLKSVMALANSTQSSTTTIGTFSSSLIINAIMHPDHVKVDFRDYAFLGNVAEDSRVCFVRTGSGIKTMKDLTSGKSIIFGATAPGTSGNVDTSILRELLHVNLHQVAGYAGSADKRLALDRGEIDGDCAGASSLPVDWIKEKKIEILVRFSSIAPDGIDPAVPFGGELIQDPVQRRIYDFLTAPQQLGRLFMVSRKIPAKKIAVLRAAFDATMKDPTFLADAARMQLPVNPTSGEQVDQLVAALYDTPPSLVKKAQALTGN